MFITPLTLASYKIDLKVNVNTSKPYLLPNLLVSLRSAREKERQGLSTSVNEDITCSSFKQVNRMTIHMITEAMDVADDSSSRQRDSCYSSSSTEDWYVVLDGQADWSRDEKQDKALHMAQVNELENQVELELMEIEVKSTIS